MISARSVLIADGVRRVPGNLWPGFKNNAGREISRAVFSGEPVRRQSDFLIERLLKCELYTAASRVGCDYVLAEEVAAETDASAAVESLLRHQVRVVAGVVCAVVNGNKEIIAEHHRPTVVFAVIGFPLDGRRDVGRVRAWLDIAENVHAGFDPMTGAKHQSRNE